MAEIFVKLLKLFASKLAQHPIQFNIKKTKLKVRQTKLFISIKDPFIKGLNHGKYLQDKGCYKNLVDNMTDLLEACQKGESL
jgi:hypothetical protein